MRFDGPDATLKKFIIDHYGTSSFIFILISRRSVYVSTKTNFILNTDKNVKPDSQKLFRVPYFTIGFMNTNSHSIKLKFFAPMRAVIRIIIHQMIYTREIPRFTRQFLNLKSIGFALKRIAVVP